MQAHIRIVDMASTWLVRGSLVIRESIFVYTEKCIVIPETPTLHCFSRLSLTPYSVNICVCLCGPSSSNNL
jgi:hypothetical protein